MVQQELTSVARPHASVTGELADILIELSSALQKFCMYRPGHPALRAAAGAVSQRLARRRGHRGTLCVAVAHDHLIVEIRPAFELARHFEGVTSRLTHPLLQALAERLRKHEVGEVALAEGVTAEELVDLLTVLATDPGQTGRPLGSEPEDVLRDLPHVRFHREGSYATGLAAGDGTPERSEDNDARLWDEFARDALGVESTDESRSYDPSEVARAIDVRSGSAPFDRRMVAHLLHIARDLGEAGALEAIELRRRISAVLRQLDRVTLRCLLNMTGDGRLRQEFLFHAAHALDVDVAFELVQTAAEDERSDISRRLIRLLSKLARHASPDETAVVRHRGEDGLRRAVRRLLSGWQLDNPIPGEYEQALAGMSMSVQTGELAASLESAVEPERVIQLSLETDVHADSLGRSVDDILRTDQTGSLLDLLDKTPTDGEVAAFIWSRLADSSVLRRLIEEENPDFEVIDRILPHAGMDAAEPLLDRLAAAESMAVRRHVFNRLTKLGSAVGPMTLQRIGCPGETPWFVLRNMLSLLVVLEELPSGFDPWTLAEHENPQVRHEALRLCLRIPERRDEAILAALTDASSRTVALGVYEAERGAPVTSESALRRIAVFEVEDPELRPHAVRALARLGTARALESLLSIARPRRRRLRKKLPDESPSLLAALRGLAEQWPDEARAAAILQLARESASPSIVEAAS
jgi:hypothetical protein